MEVGVVWWGGAVADGGYEEVLCAGLGGGGWVELERMFGLEVVGYCGRAQGPQREHVLEKMHAGVAGPI